MTTTADFDYARFVDQLEEVIYWHQAWHMRLMGALLFGRPFVDVDHHHCHFGKFLDTTATPPGRDDEIAQIGQLHARMHKLAGEMLLEMRETEQVNEEQFDEFMESQSLFFTVTGGLLRSTIEDGVKSREL
ncbi:MAG: CZB domain-containing protein [Halothiobacillaceae bacterium]